MNRYESKNITEELKKIAERKRLERIGQPDFEDDDKLGLVDPIICNGKADIIITNPEDNEREM